MFRFTKLLSLALLLMLVACRQSDEQKAEQLAREYMTRAIGVNAVNRAHVETRSSEAGWQVIFRDAYASSKEGSLGPDACGWGGSDCVFRDVYACIDGDWMIRQVGGSPATVSLEAQDVVCQALPPIAPAPTAAGDQSALQILKPTPTLVACQPSQIQQSKNDFPEIQGTMRSGGEMWALLFFDKAHAKEDAKIVWRITGSGKQFSVQARHDDGTVIFPIWGPDDHGQGSNWERPGNEWGTGFNFPKPGCWTLTATRGTTTGEIRLDVLAP
jgi:hypothetical protein